MLLSSIGRASFERATITISCSKNRVLHILLNAHRVKSTYVKKPSFTINSINFPRRSYATATRSASGIKQKSKAASTKSASTKSARSASKGKKTKISKKVSSPLKKKKIVKKVTKKPKKSKKVLSEKEKLTRKQISLRIKALKPPINLPQTARTLYMADKLKGYNGGNINAKFTEFSAVWKNLSEPELQVYRNQAEANRVANAKIMKEWVLKHSPDQIRLANNARRNLSKLYPLSNQWKQILDERQPKKPMTPFICFVKERYSSGEYAGTNFLEVSKKLSSEFKALTPSDRKKYEDLSREFRQKYVEDYRQTFSRDPKSLKSVVE